MERGSSQPKASSKTEENAAPATTTSPTAEKERREGGERGSKEAAIDKSKSLPPPPTRRSASKGATDKSDGKKSDKAVQEIESEKEERKFQESLSKAKTQSERDRLIARRKKFQSAEAVIGGGKEAKVISLKSAKSEAAANKKIVDVAKDKKKNGEEDQMEDNGDALELGVDVETLNMFDEGSAKPTLEDKRHHQRDNDKKPKGGVTDLRVQLHRKRMMRGSKDKSPNPPPTSRGQKRQAISEDDRDLTPDRGHVQRSTSRVGVLSPPRRGGRGRSRSPPSPPSSSGASSGRQILITRPQVAAPVTSRGRRGRERSSSPGPAAAATKAASSGSDYDDEDESVIKKPSTKRTNVMSRLGEPVHLKAKKARPASLSPDSDRDHREEKRVYVQEDSADEEEEEEAAAVVYSEEDDYSSEGGGGRGGAADSPSPRGHSPRHRSRQGRSRTKSSRASSSPDNNRTSSSKSPSKASSKSPKKTSSMTSSSSKEKKKKKEKKKDKRERKLEKKLKKLKEQVSSLRSGANSDDIDKLLSSSSLSDILNVPGGAGNDDDVDDYLSPAKSKTKKKGKKRESGGSAASPPPPPAAADDTEEALFAFFENEGS